MPYYSEITKTKKKNILQIFELNFEEVEYYSNDTILKREGCSAEYIYIILRGYLRGEILLVVQEVTTTLSKELSRP